MEAETIQTVKITRAELEKLSKDFLMRALRIFALQKDWVRMCIAAGFLPEFLRKKVFSLVLKGPFGLMEINSQAREGKGLFAQAGRPSSQEQKLEEIIENRIKQARHIQDDIISEIGRDIGKKLAVSEIEEVVLVCFNAKRFDLAREAANNLPLTKRAQAISLS